MRVDLAAPPPATAPLARTGNSGLQGKRVRRSTHRPAAATTRSATASPPINRHDRRAAIRTPRARHSNPHSARGTAARSPSAVSSPGGFRTPAPGVPGTDTHRAGIRNPSQKRSSVVGVIMSSPKALGSRRSHSISSEAGGDIGASREPEGRNRSAQPSSWNQLRAQIGHATLCLT